MWLYTSHFDEMKEQILEPKVGKEFNTRVVWTKGLKAEEKNANVRVLNDDK